MLNIFVIANENSEVWQNRYSEIASQNNLLSGFASWVRKKSRVSMNRSWSTVVRLLDGEPIKNHHEIAREKAIREGGGADAESYLKISLKDAYSRRVSFDRAFEDGESFRYGAINCGGVGLEKYGPLCLVFNEETHSSIFAALLPGDSLNLCCTLAGEFKEHEFRKLVGSFDQRDLYAAVHCSDAACNSTPNEWTSVILDDADAGSTYLEVLFIGTITLGCLESIRISKASHANAWEAVYSGHGTEVVSSTKQLFLISRGSYWPVNRIKFVWKSSNET